MEMVSFLLDNRQGKIYDSRRHAHFCVHRIPRVFHVPNSCVVVLVMQQQYQLPIRYNLTS